MNRFGDLLRQHRTSCSNPDHSGRALSQEKLGALIGDVLGDQGYTGSAVSEWERGRSQIPKDHRAVLVALIKVLHDCGGLDSLTEADNLLQAGHYRALNNEEMRQISTGWSQDDGESEATARQLFPTLFKELLQRPLETIRELPSQEKSVDATPLDFAKLLAGMLERLFRPWTSARVLHLAIWLAVWLLVWLSALPLLDWPPAGRSAAQSAGIRYAAGAVVLPILITLLAYHRDKHFWRSRFQSRNSVIAFMLMGALAGFHFATLTLFALRMATFYLDLVFVPRLLQAIAALWATILPYLLARLVPDRFWRAFHNLSFTEGDRALFIVLCLFGPLLGLSFPTIYPLLLTPIVGLAFILCTVILISATLIWQHHSGASLLPALFAAVASLVFVLQQESLLEVVIVSGVAITVVVALAQEKLEGTLAGATMALIAVGAVALTRLYDPFVARLLGIVVFVLWLIWGRRHLWFPLSFWIIVVAAAACLYLAEVGPWNEAQIATAFTLVTAANLVLANVDLPQIRTLD